MLKGEFQKIAAMRVTLKSGVKQFRWTFEQKLKSSETEAHSMVTFWIQLRRAFRGKVSSQVKIEFGIMHILVKIGIFIISKYVFEVL